MKTLLLFFLSVAGTTVYADLVNETLVTQDGMELPGQAIRSVKTTNLSGTQVEHPATQRSGGLPGVSSLERNPASDNNTSRPIEQTLGRSGDLPAQNSACPRSLIVPTPLFNPKVSGGELYARLCSEVRVKWSEPQVLEGNRFR